MKYEPIRILLILGLGAFSIWLIFNVFSMIDWNYEETTMNKEALCEKNNMVMNTCKIFDSYYCCFVKGDNLTEYPIVYDYETKTASFGKVGNLDGEN